MNWLQIQAAFERCAGGATCNCAVFIRSHQSVFIVDHCRRDSCHDCHVTTPARVIVANSNRPSSGSNINSWQLGMRVFSRTDHELEVFDVYLIH